MMNSPQSRFELDFPDLHDAIRVRAGYQPGDPPSGINLPKLFLTHIAYLKGLHLIAPDNQHWQLTLGEDVHLYSFVTTNARGALRMLLAPLAFEIERLFSPEYYRALDEFTGQSEDGAPTTREAAVNKLHSVVATLDQIESRFPRDHRVNPYGFDVVLQNGGRIRTDNTNPNYWLRID